MKGTDTFLSERKCSVYDMLPEKSKMQKYNRNKNQQKRFKPMLQMNVVQRKLPGYPKNARELMKMQIELQEKSEDEIAAEVLRVNPEDEGAYTTVGFEHEFAKFKEDQLNPLHGKEHIELAKSNITLGQTGLPFILETDYDDTIELVGAPLIIPTPKEYPVPFADDVNKVDFYIQSALMSISGAEDFKGMKQAFFVYMGLCFENETAEAIDDLSVHFGAMGGKIAPQVNFATSAVVYDAAKEVSLDKSQGDTIKKYLDKEGRYRAKIDEISGNDIPPNVKIFLKELAKNLGFTDFAGYLAEFNKMKGSDKSGIELWRAGLLISLVKDTNTFWLKDTIFNFGMGLLTPAEWQMVLDICKKMKDNPDFKDCVEPIKKLIQKIELLTMNGYKLPYERPHVEYGQHDPEYLGARQDTYVSLDGNKKAPQFKDTTLHLVEARGLGGKYEAGDLFHKVEEHLLELSPLQFKDIPSGLDMEIKYVKRENAIIISTSSSNPPAIHESKSISSSNLYLSKIRYDDLEDGDGDRTAINIPTGPASSYTIELNGDQTSQFRSFINRLTAVNSYQSIPPLQSQSTPLGFDMEMRYVMEENAVVIRTSSQNPFLRSKIKKFTLPELKKSKIECEDLEDDGSKMITIVTDSETPYIITLNRDSASQFQYFIYRLLEITS